MSTSNIDAKSDFKSKVSSRPDTKHKAENYKVCDSLRGRHGLAQVLFESTQSDSKCLHQEM